MLSVVVLTKNSEKYLAAVLSSASFADEIIVLDSGSSDNTEQIAISFANVRFIRQAWLGFGAMKQLGVDLVAAVFLAGDVDAPGIHASLECSLHLQLRGADAQFP